MATSAPDAVKRLVDRFDQDRKVFLSGDYKEEQLRLEFLNPFFTALGWDMDNKQGLSETFKQVIHEESIKVAGATKARTAPSASAAAAPRCQTWQAADLTPARNGWRRRCPAFCPPSS